MFELFDRVLDKTSGKPCFVIDVDDHGADGVIYGLEVEDQQDQDWFRWAREGELEKLPEHEPKDDDAKRSS